MSDGSQARFIPLESGRFRFACHPGVSCFTECCADLKLVLTPYDLLRLKNRLGLTYGQFVERYTEPLFEEGRSLPQLRLVMGKRGRKPCPFVTPGGCEVYEDRPSACRYYPLGRAASRPPGRTDVSERFFLVQEAHCRGFEEPAEWHVASWMKDQGIEPYNRFNDLWMDIITHPVSLGSGEIRTRKTQMFFMASYGLDTFKRFVFESSFLDSFEVDPATLDEIRQDEEALLAFSFRWLRFALFGEQTLPLRSTASRGSRQA